LAATAAAAKAEKLSEKQLGHENVDVKCEGEQMTSKWLKKRSRKGDKKPKLSKLAAVAAIRGPDQNAPFRSNGSDRSGSDSGEEKRAAPAAPAPMLLGYLEARRLAAQATRKHDAAEKPTAPPKKLRALTMVSKLQSRTAPLACAFGDTDTAQGGGITVADASLIGPIESTESPGHTSLAASLEKLRTAKATASALALGRADVSALKTLRLREQPAERVGQNSEDTSSPAARPVVPLGSLPTTPVIEPIERYRSQLDQVKHHLGANVISSKIHFRVRAGLSSFANLGALALKNSLLQRVERTPSDL
jgi:hypothetical protein